MKCCKTITDNKGQALIIVIAVLTILLVVPLAFFVLSQAERIAAIRNLDSLRAQYLAEAGVVYARQILKLDKQTNAIDSLADLPFTHFQGEDADLDGDGNNESRWFNVSDSQDNTFGRFCLKVSDDASRLNINSSSSEVLGNLFSALGLSQSKLNALLSRRPFNAKEELQPILGARDFSLAKDFLSAYSRDPEMDLDNNRRAYLNSPQSRVILEAFLNAGVKDAYQKAANLKDASDVDLAQTLLDKFSLNFEPAGLSEPGAWQKIDDFYEAPAGAQAAGEFFWSNLPIEDGEYYCFLYGPESADVVGGDPPMFSGEGLKEAVSVQGGSFSLALNAAKDYTSRFSYVELVSMDSRGGLERKIITGSEALVINEVMVKPRKEILTETPGSIEPGQTAVWIFTGVRPGDYYVVVKALTQGGLVGDCSINGESGNNLADQDYFPETVNVGSDGNLTIQIKNNSLQNTSFKGIDVLQQPDAEFTEIVNVSAQEIDLDDFSLEVYTDTGELVSGWPARIPANTKIQPYQHLVLAVDSNDALSTPENLAGNGISFKGVYEVDSAGLFFDEAGAINKDSDLIPDFGGRIILKDARGQRIDAVEYTLEQAQDFISLERADPTLKADADSNGFFDGWYISESTGLATPAAANENSGMYVSSGKKDISSINVFNRPLSTLIEAQQLSSGENWEQFSSEDISNMADHFAYEVMNFDMASHSKGFTSDNTGLWEFPDIPGDSYLLSIFSDSLDFDGNEIRVSAKVNGAQVAGGFKSLLLEQGVAFYGTVDLPEAASTLQLEIAADAQEILLSLKEIQLEPVSFARGRININTAQPEILRSLFPSGALVDIILNNRPLGATGGRNLGIGELFLLDNSSIPFYNVISVKSDLYEINCRGESLAQEKALAYQIIRTVVERSR